jgi:hypothetical protein
MFKKLREIAAVYTIDRSLRFLMGWGDGTAQLWEELELKSELGTGYYQKAVLSMPQSRVKKNKGMMQVRSGQGQRCEPQFQEDRGRMGEWGRSHGSVRSLAGAGTLE